jgi:hypothetical protein
MSFEYIVDKASKKLSKEDIDYITKSVVEDFDTFNENRRQNLDMAEALSNEIFFKKAYKIANSKASKEEAWKTKVNMAKTYMFYQVLKSYIWKNTYSNTNSMFDVSGENQEADNDSNKQKAALVDCFEKMEYQKTCDKAIDYALLYGEMITFCAWKKKYEEVRRKITAADLTKPAALAALAKGKFHFVDEKLIYDNPYVYAVNPANFVFDASQKDNWDDCPKIYRSFKTPNDIINNKYYKVSKDDAEAIRASIKAPELGDSQQDKDLENKETNGRTVELLEHWGNLTLKNGTVLKNWHVVIAAKKYLIRFERNNRIVNPFTFGTLTTDPETCRGISPLYCTLSLAELQEDLMNRTCDMQSLQENPPIYAPEGFFDEEEIKLYPGKIIEFGDNLNPAQIKQMEFSVGIFLNDITFLSDLMAETSGIFPNMAGADEQKAKTATEISTKTQGQLTRLSMLIDIINQYMIVDDVKKVAKLRADFKSGEEQIFVDKGSEKETIVINDSIRQGEYRYKYSDRTATTERSNKADMIMQAVERFAQYLPLNVQELFTWYMEQKDVENPERFLQMGMQIPLEIQQKLLEDPRIRAIVEGYNQQIAQGANENKPNEAPVAIPEQSTPEAQPME